MDHKSRAEKLSAEVHQVYCKAYEKRFGKPYWTGGDYTKLKEESKDYDRAFVAWHLSKIQAVENEAIDKAAMEFARTAQTIENEALESIAVRFDRIGPTTMTGYDTAKVIRSLMKKENK